MDSIINLFNKMGPNPTSTKIQEFQTKVREHLASTNPTNLDMSKTPVTTNQINHLNKDLSITYQKIFDTYHKYTTFELDMARCMHMDTKEEKETFFPSMLLPNESHKSAIQKLAIRFIHPNMNSQEKASFEEKNWVKRTLENLPSFTSLRSLHITITHKPNPETPINQHNKKVHSTPHWTTYQQQLTDCLDNLPKLQTLHLTTSKEDTTTSGLLEWLNERYNLKCTDHKCARLCDCKNQSWRKNEIIPVQLGEEITHEWKAEWDEWKSESRRSLEFEREEDDDEGEWDGDWFDDEVVEIKMPGSQVIEVGEMMSFEEMVEVIRRELGLDEESDFEV